MKNSLKTDPYFKPIIYTAIIVICLNTFLSLPVFLFPFITYFAGGVFSVVMFKRQFEDENKEVLGSDAAILGLGSGSLVGSILTLIICLKLNNPETQELIVSMINERMQAQVNPENFQALENLGPGFFIITGVFTILFCAVFCWFGSLASLAFINPKKQ